MPRGDNFSGGPFLHMLIEPRWCETLRFQVASGLDFKSLAICQFWASMSTTLISLSFPGRLIFYHWCWRARGAAPVKTSTGNSSPRKYQRIPRNYYQCWCCNRGRLLQDWESPSPPKVPGRVLGRVLGKGGVLGDCWEQCWEVTFFGKRRNSTAPPPALTLFPALFPALSPVLLGDSGLLSPVAGGPDCNTGAKFWLRFASRRLSSALKINSISKTLRKHPPKPAWRPMCNN